jgi:hypothetical protein
VGIVEPTTIEDARGTRPTGPLAARVYPPGARLAAGALVAMSRASLLLILAAVVVATDPPVTPPVLLRMVVGTALLPALAAWALGRAFAARIDLDDAALHIHRRDLEVDVPRTSVAGVSPWRVPLPGPGLSLRLRSGRRLAWGIQTDDPTAVVQALGAPEAAAHPTVVYGHARAGLRRRRWYHAGAKYAGFGLGPAAILFNAHQHIAYGGPLGQYRLHGLGPYLWTFAVYWVTTVIYLVLWAALWRTLAEGAAWLAAAAAPARAARVRRAAERSCQVAYYGGVPVLLLLRFLP